MLSVFICDLEEGQRAAKSKCAMDLELGANKHLHGTMYGVVPRLYAAGAGVAFGNNYSVDVEKSNEEIHLHYTIQVAESSDRIWNKFPPLSDLIISIQPGTRTFTYNNQIKRLCRRPRRPPPPLTRLTGCLKRSTTSPVRISSLVGSRC